jgi:hypothetical protein
VSGYFRFEGRDALRGRNKLALVFNQMIENHGSNQQCCRRPATVLDGGSVVDTLSVAVNSSLLISPTLIEAPWIVFTDSRRG